MYIVDILNLMIGKFQMNLDDFYSIKQANIHFVTECINRMIRILIGDHVI